MKKFIIGIVSAILLSPCTTFAQGVDSVQDSILYTDDTDMYFIEESIPAENGEIYLMENETLWDGILTEAPEEDGNIYHITSAAQLAWLAREVENKDAKGDPVCLTGKTVLLEADIDLNGFSWVPIGSDGAPFNGVFDGQGHTISNLCFDASSYTDAGLFGCVIGTVKNLTVSTVPEGIDTYRRSTPAGGSSLSYGIGIIAGCVDARRLPYDSKSYTGSVYDCRAEGTLTVSNGYGEQYFVGGAVGMNNGTVSGCSAAAAVNIYSDNLNGADEAFAGAIAGGNTGALTDCAVTDNCRIFIKSSNPAAGGICGYNSGVTENCTSGAVFEFEKLSSKLSNYINIGGISGYSSGTLHKCTYIGGISVSSDGADFDASLNIGGIAGICAGTAYGCEADGSLTVNSPTKLNIGSIAGIAGSSEDEENAEGVIQSCRGGMSVEALNQRTNINAGAIAGKSYAVIDSCSASPSVNDPSVLINASGDFTVNLGAVAGANYNTISDCTAEGVIISSECTSLASSTVYGGGIVGGNSGYVKSCRSRASVVLSGVRSFAGGIAGASAYDRNENPISDKADIAKCVSGGSVKANSAGGISGSASSSAISQCVSEGSVNGSAYCGGVLSEGNNIDIQNCIVTAALSSLDTNPMCGAVSSLKGDETLNIISKLYISPRFDGAGAKHMLISDDAVLSTRSLCYYNKDITGVDSDAYAHALTSAEAADKNSFKEDNVRYFNFDNIWTIRDGAPALQAFAYSNSSAVVSSQSATLLTLSAELENPTPGEKVYIAFYNDENRCVGTVSGICTDSEDGAPYGSFVINRTGTKATASLDYKYSYYDFTTWEKAADAPSYYKVFTWDELYGMRELSSVYSRNIQYTLE